MTSIRLTTIRLFAMLALFVAVMVLGGPVAAYSDLAQNFLRACRTYDRHFPPEDWSNDDLRAAALEVLDNYESTGSDSWVVGFCLTTLGHTKNPDDLPRILAYEDKMKFTVLRAVGGFPAPDAIECMLRFLVSDRATFRELAIKGLKAVDYSQMDDPDKWRDRILENLQTAKSNETVSQLVDLIDETVAEIKASPDNQSASQE